MEDRIKAAFAEIHADQALVQDTMAYVREKSSPRRKGLAVRRLAAAMAVLAVAVFSGSLYFTPDAYVSIDVNPSVELTLNRFDKVIATYAFNEDGQRILRAADPQGKRYDEAAGLLIAYIEANGYFADDVLVSVTVQANSGDREFLLCTGLQQLIDERLLSIQASAALEVYPVSAEVWDHAHGCNISPAKYLAIQELLEIDSEATLDAYSDASISQIRRRAMECHGMSGWEGTDNDGAPGQGDMHGHGMEHGCDMEHGYGME